MPTSDLLRDHPDAWDRATRHQFLLGVRDGSLPAGAFDTWLVQDARYVADLLRFRLRKRKAIAAAIKGGWVNVIVTDLATARELLAA